MLNFGDHGVFRRGTNGADGFPGFEANVVPSLGSFDELFCKRGENAQGVGIESSDRNAVKAGEASLTPKLTVADHDESSGINEHA